MSTIIKWSGDETPKMKSSMCSLVVDPTRVEFSPWINQLQATANVSIPSRYDVHQVDFPELKAVTIHMETRDDGAPASLPLDLTVAGKCSLTYMCVEEFNTLMDYQALQVYYNPDPEGIGGIDMCWPDSEAVFCCPVCSKGAETGNEYWLCLHPLVQMHHFQGSSTSIAPMVATVVIARLLCLSCWETVWESVKETDPERYEIIKTRGIDRNPALFERELTAWQQYTLWEQMGAIRILEKKSHRQLEAMLLHHDNNPDSEDSDERSINQVGEPRGGITESLPPATSTDDSGTTAPVASAPVTEAPTPIVPNIHTPTDDSGSVDTGGRRLRLPRIGGNVASRPRDTISRKESKVVKGGCVVCDKVTPDNKRCSRCRKANYCGMECQRKDWSRHKTECVRSCLVCNLVTPHTSQCSRCQKATYCGMECQRKDWSRHKMECVKK